MIFLEYVGSRASLSAEKFTRFTHQKRLSNNSNLGSLFFMFANNITISRYL